MSKAVKLKGNLHWKKYNDGSDFYISHTTDGSDFYRPYTIIDGKRYKLLGVSVDKLDLDNGFVYRLYIDFRFISYHHSFQSAMVKAEEILRDFTFYKDDVAEVLGTAYRNGDNNYKLGHTIIGWKKAYSDSDNDLIVKIRIPRGTRCNLTATKCRAEKAEVVGVYRIAMIVKEDKRSNLIFPDVSLVQLPDDTNIHSIYAVKMNKYVAYKSYKVGDTLEITDFNTTSDTCASGIHFFRSVKKAIDFEF